MPENSSTTTVHSVELSLKAVLEDFVRGMRSAEQQSRTTAQRMGQDFRGVEQSAFGVQRAVHGLKSAFLELAGAFGVAYSTYQISQYFRSITQLAGRVEVLEVVSRNMGKTAGYTREEVLRYVQAVKDLNITTQEANLSTTKFMQAGLPLDKLTKVVRVAQDTGVIMGKSTQESLAGIVHGIITLQPEVLRTYGIFTNLDMAYRKFARTTNITYDEISQQQKQQIALNEVLEKGAVFVGTYETAMTKAHKQLLSLERVTEEFKVSMGREFQMLFSSLVTTATELLTVGKNSAELHQIFKGIADGAFYAVTAIIALGKALWELKEAIGTGVILFTLYKIIPLVSSAILTLANSVLGASFAFNGLLRSIAPLAIAYTLFQILKDAPAVFSALAVAVGIAATAFAWLSVTITAAQAAMLTPLTMAIAVGGVLGLLTSAYSSLNTEAERTIYEHKQLVSSTSATSSEYRVGRMTALELAQGIEELGKKSSLTKTEIDEVHKSFERLRKLAPDVVTDVKDIKDIFSQATKAVKELDLQIVDLSLNQLSAQLFTLKREAKALEISSSAFVVFPSWDEAGREFKQWADEALKFQENTQQGVFSQLEWGRLNTQYSLLRIKYGKEINDIEAQILASKSASDSKTAQGMDRTFRLESRRNELGRMLDIMSEAYISAGRFGDKVASIADIEDQILKLETSRTTIVSGLGKEMLTQEQIENRLQAQHQMRMQLFELQKKAGKDINFLKEKELEADKDIAQAMEILRKAENLGETGKEYQELIALLKTYKTLMSEQAQVELQLHDIRLKEKLMKVGVQTDDVQSLKDLRTEYGLLIAQLSSLPMTDAVVELLDTYRAKFKALGVEIPELIQKLADADDREKMRLQREKERADRKLARGWLSDLGVQAQTFRFFMGTYRSFIDNMTNLTLTGKERGIAIWQDMLNEFKNIVDLMIRKWLIFTALTGIFSVPAGVAGELLGFGTGSGGGIFSAGGDNRQVVRELQQINSTLGDRRGGAVQTLSITADRLDATVTTGARQRGRNRLNGNR